MKRAGRHDDYLFTSESVSEGHPDKVADQISDAILDAILAQDPNARVACETLCSTGLIVMSGEITTEANVDYIQVARAAVKRIGYDSSDIGFRLPDLRSPDRFQQTIPRHCPGREPHQGRGNGSGGGRSGLMFGYACDETPQLMPMPIYYAHRLMERQAELEKGWTPAVAAPGCEIAGIGALPQW